MPKALVIRPGHAIGDAIFITPIPRLLAEKGYEVHVACMPHNFEVFDHNPYINKLIPLPDKANFAQWVEEFREEQLTYDETFACSGHVEVGLLHRTDTQWGGIPSIEERREKAKDVNYQDLILEKLGFEERGLLPEFYFSQEEQDMMAAIQEQMAEDKKQLVLWQWDGSSGSKTLTWAPFYLREVMKRKQNITHYVFTPHMNMAAQIPEHPNVFNAWGASGIRNTIQLCAMADMVIGPESFMVNAAAAFETPKLIFFSHSAPDNLAKHYLNCHAAIPVPDVKCHPCYLIHVDFRNVFHPEKRAIARLYEKNCQVKDPQFGYGYKGYKCCFYLPHQNIVDTIVNVLKKKPKEKKKHVGNQRSNERRQPGGKVQGLSVGGVG